MEKILQIINNVGGFSSDNLIHYARLLFADGCVRNPRHNFCHNTDVLEAGYDAALHCRFGERFGKDKLFGLLLAHLWHDIGHSGRMRNDKEEVERAISIMEANILPQHEHLLPDITTYQQGTQYPHLLDFPGEDAPEYLRVGVDIIRDADMTPLFREDWLQTIVFGLSAEMGLTPLQMLLDQPKFIAGLKFRTQYFQGFYNKNAIAGKLEEVESWIRILSK